MWSGRSRVPVPTRGPDERHSEQSLKDLSRTTGIAKRLSDPNAEVRDTTIGALEYLQKDENETVRSEAVSLTKQWRKWRRLLRCDHRGAA